MAKKRRGMIIKNANTQPVEIAMATRTIRLEPGQEQLISADEVRDTVLREHLQVRAINIVRPATDEEEEELRRILNGNGTSE